MKRRTMMTASIAVLTAILFSIPGLAQAQTYGNWCSDGSTLYYDPSHKNVQSPWTCIYPTANWSCFFIGFATTGPVLWPQPKLDLRYRWYLY
jgi:hypothetical protein